MAQKKQKAGYGILTEIYNPSPVPTTPGKIDWGIKSFADLQTRRNDLLSGAQKTPAAVTPLNEGTLLTVFNTVAKGDKLWEGVVDLEFERDKKPYPFNPAYKQQESFGMWVHGFQADMEPEEWSSMFFMSFPARLEKDGKTLFGSLEPFFETGTEGVIWAVTEYGRKGYDGLNILENGDKLTVYENVTDGNIAWQGRVSFDCTQNMFTVHNGTYPIHTERTPKHIAPDQWQQMYWDRNPVKIAP